MNKLETRVVGKRDPDTPGDPKALIATLASHDPVACGAARDALIEMGAGAASALAEALRDERDHVRWEAAKALVRIASPAAAPDLVATLRDHDSGIRWVAAEALIALGADGLEPLLQGVIEHAGSLAMREGAHRVLRALIGDLRPELTWPVLAALEGVAPVERAPIAAAAALRIYQREYPLGNVTRSPARTGEGADPRRQD